MKVMSWNVNGIRAVLRKNFEEVLEREKPDIASFQEIKISQDKIEGEKFPFSDYTPYWNPAQRPGYSGTLTLIKKEALSKLNSELEIKNDDEGRIQIFDSNSFYLVNCYFPNSGPQLKRLDYKLEFDEYILDKINKLQAEKPVILTGDFNVAHKEIDIARPEDNKGKAGFTEEERNWMDKLLANDFIDSFRYFNPDKIQYTWWSYRAGARSRNVGWRLDYMCLSDKLIEYTQDSYIKDQIQGSDHAPVFLILNL